MPATYEPIATQTLGSAAASVTFSSIPATYTDLVLVINSKSGSAARISFRLNGDSGTNYSRTSLDGNGSATSSDRTSNDAQADTSRFNATASPMTLRLHFMNYSNTTTNKTIISRSDDATQEIVLNVNLWRSTAAINQIVVTQTDFSIGSTFTLYGIKSA